MRSGNFYAELKVIILLWPMQQIGCRSTDMHHLGIASDNDLKVIASQVHALKVLLKA